MAAAGPPTDDELNASRLLADKTARTLAVAIKSSGGLLVSDAARPLPAEARSDAEAAIAKLQEAGLVKTELVVICNKTDAQVARATTKKQLDQSARAGITCACGQPLTAERVEEALTIADLARDLLDGNRWMSVLLFDELVRVGVNAERIFLEQQAGGDEVDCVADISGEFVLFELKDKEFNLGNAYSFGAKIGILRPEHPVVITTEYVGGDAKEHFERAAASGTRPSTLERSHQRPVLYIEGLENLRSGVEQLAYQIYRADGATLLDDVLSVASIQSGSILAALGDDEKQSAASSRRTTRDRARKARAT
jgi:hypothetical protein